METFRYFAYGSNMLTSRLNGRCESAKFRTLARVNGYRFEFSKRSIDESGKANVVQCADHSVLGVVFELSATELKILDAFEGADYQRCNLPVTCMRTGDEIETCVYLARKREDGLAPYDWYLALVIAGLEEHGIDSDYAAVMRSLAYDIDQNLYRKQRRAAIGALEMAGIKDYRILLT